MASPTPVAPKESLFGTTSVVCTALAVLLPITVILFTVYRVKQFGASHPEWEGGVWTLLGGLMLALVVAGVSSLFGTLAGIVSLVRGERQPRRAKLGLLVNVLVLIAVTFFVTFLCAVPQW